jgi:hypothetical protein
MVNITEAVESAILRALARDPAERFASAAHFAEALAGVPPTTSSVPATRKGCAAMLLLGILIVIGGALA